MLNWKTEQVEVPSQCVHVGGALSATVVMSDVTTEVFCSLEVSLVLLKLLRLYF